jgi:hypothetical protein
MLMLNTPDFRRCHAFLFGIVLVLGSTTAALAAEEDASRYSDEKFGFSLTVPKPWKSARLQGFSIPGVARAAWSGPRGASIVAFIQEPGKAYSPRFLVDASAKAMKEKLGAKVLAQEVRAVGGKQAMWLVVEAKGTGGAITGKGDVDTTQHWVAIPRTQDVVVVLLTCPSADFEAIEKSFDEVVTSIKVKGDQTREQKEAK